MPKDENAYYVPRPEKCPHCKLAVETANAFCERCGWDLVSGLTKRAQRGSRVKCIYCEERRPRTVEDIFPKWLSRQFPNCPSRAPNRVRRATELKAFSRPVLYADPAKKPARKAYHLTTKEVCGPCNNGWMSNLQDQMKPILLKMIGSNSSGVSLNEDEKIIATRWCCMTFINLFYSENANSTLQHQRTAIMNGQVPRGWSVGAGILNDRSMAGRYERYSAGMLIESFDRPFTPFTGSNLIIENVVFACIETYDDHVAEMIEMTLGVSPEAYLRRAGLTPIWLSAVTGIVEELYKDQPSPSKEVLARANALGSRFFDENDLNTLRIEG